jgi:acetyl-CoA carboxylase biotin carboxylase subunit
MGSKTAARTAAIAAGVPVVPGTDRSFAIDADDAALRAAAEGVGFPLLVKAVAGGGGKGMRRVAASADLASAVRTARSEALSAFGDGAVYFEREIVTPRHIEIQLLGDEHGTVVPFVERECSIQRRHQKVFEESPSPVVDPETRRAMAADAERVARSVGYTNAGTIEFLFETSSAGPRWYFLEMNTRLQVEHPVTELVTGLDLVQWQIRIARGERLTLAPEDALVPRGHAMECRVYAEDPDTGFLPAPGLVREISAPGGPGVRDDRGVAAGFEIPTFYDSMIAKLIVWGGSREAAAARLRRAIAEYRVVGVKTSLPFFEWLLDRPEFHSASFDTGYLDRVLAERAGEPFVAASDLDEVDAVVAAAIAEWHRAGTAGRLPSAVSSGGWRTAARRDALR